jgi:MoxR-like ATPase
MTQNKRPIEPHILAQVAEIAQRTYDEVRQAYIGPSSTLEILLIALLARGHVLLEGVPGVAKTTLAKSFSATLGCQFKRIQFTPDLLPADITGTFILNPRENTFVLRRGPIFSQIVLGDEINRAPAKTQSALLEAMAERQVTIEGETHVLAEPFLVIATQNPVEQEGVYSLPEAQLDRFLAKVVMGYPTEEEEMRVYSAYNKPVPEPKRILTPQDIIRLRELADTVYIDDALLTYIIGITRFTRTHRFCSLGASPRAGLALLHSAKARALLHGRDYVLPDDVKFLANYVLCHRLFLTAEADLEGGKPEAVVQEALNKVRYVEGN